MEDNNYEEKKNPGQTIANKLNNFIHIATVMHRNLHILHWNMYGCSFLKVHKYFNDLYDDLMDNIDMVAEELRKNDIYPDAGLDVCLKSSSIKPISGNQKYSIEEAIDIAINNYKTLLELTDCIATIANENELYCINDLMIQFMHEYNKAIWMLKSSR